MGSLISGILAEIKLRKLEKTISKFESTIIHWFRYIDDIFAIVKEDCIIKIFIKELNSIDYNKNHI